MEFSSPTRQVVLLPPPSMPRKKATPVFLAYGPGLRAWSMGARPAADEAGTWAADCGAGGGKSPVVLRKITAGLAGPSRRTRYGFGQARSHDHRDLSGGNHSI